MIDRMALDGKDLPTLSEAIAYEVYGSWLLNASFLLKHSPSLIQWIAKAKARKVKRRYKRIHELVKFERRTRLTRPEI